jgi:hypothetical protein
MVALALAQWQPGFPQQHLTSAALQHFERGSLARMRAATLELSKRSYVLLAVRTPTAISPWEAGASAAAN